jgi:hypothetical protein
MKTRLFTLIGAVVFVMTSLISCSPKITQNLAKNYTPLDASATVVVFDEKMDAPQPAEILGSIKIGDSGFSTNCDYETVISEAQNAARKAGGNAVKITKHSTPGIWSSCHRITANILKIDSLDNYIQSTDNEIDSSLTGADYALLHLYRPSGAGALIGYDIHLGDEVIAEMSNNSYKTVAVKNEGLVTFWAKTESKSELKMDIQHGKRYYIRCSMNMGFFVGHPKLTLVNNRTGKIEFEKIENSKKKKEL